VHAFEALRYVARTHAVDGAELGEMAAHALMGVADDPMALTLSCKRLVDAHVETAPVWWVAANVLGSADPYRAAMRASDRLINDRSLEHLVRRLSGVDALIAVEEPWLASVATACGDLAMVAVASGRGARSFHEGLDDLGVDCISPDEVGDLIGAADLVLVEALAASPRELLLARESAALVELAHVGDVEAIVLVREGHLLPEALFASFLACQRERTRPETIRVEASVVTQIASATGVAGPAAALARPACPSPPELASMAPRRAARR
jgi:hypothetical protein